LSDAPLRLPRQIEGDPRAARVRDALSASARPLWARGTLAVATAPLDAALAAALARAHEGGRLRRGLEAIAQQLDAEAKGMADADRASGAARGARVSRLLLVSDDGAERFYRHVETLLRRHADRVLGVRLEAGAAELGALLFGPSALARVVLVEHKDAVAAVLLALAER
jgi:hypothetical protein